MQDNDIKLQQSTGTTGMEERRVVYREDWIDSKPMVERKEGQTDEEWVDDTFKVLIEAYKTTRHRQKVDIITKAFNFARQAHKGVKRLSGEPYILHPLNVAYITCKEIGLGSTSISAALLHDVVEDTDYTVEDIENVFGPKIAQIVDGLTKISGGIFADQALATGMHPSAQAENIKKLLLTMSEDIRVILIKIADRLHNMRTLASQPANKQYKIAGETMYIYAPLANRLGLNKIKNELENLSFKYEHKELYDEIVSKISSTDEERRDLFNEFTAPIREELDKMGLTYRIQARVKSPYSIWKKMQNKHVSFNEIYDILAVRIIFTPISPAEELNECFQIYVAINKIYKSHPDRLRDWVNHPKANGYQALHATYMSHRGQWIEVQIRSEKMDEQAEHGFAAHWKYKDAGVDVNNKEEQISEDDGELNEWLRTIKEILDDPQPDAMDFLDAVKMNLFSNEIFVFTPKGELRTMPMGSTALDFAFSIHTFLGTHCIGAKVNHRLVPMSHKLQSGDQVEILTSKSQHVDRSWLEFVTTAKANAKIQAVLRKVERDTRKNGEDKLNAFLEEHNVERTTDNLTKILNYYELERLEDLYQDIGDEKIELSDKMLSAINKDATEKKNWRRYVPFLKSKDSNTSDKKQLITVDKDFDKKKAIVLTEDTINMYKISDCCHPIPGDDVLGYINNLKQIEIHRRDCKIANKLKSSFGNRIVDAKWKMDKKSMLFDAALEINGIDRIGVLNEVTQVISQQMNVNIHKVYITCEKGIFNGKFELKVHDRSDVKTIEKNLLQIDDIKEVKEVK